MTGTVSGMWCSRRSSKVSPATTSRDLSLPIRRDAPPVRMTRDQGDAVTSAPYDQEEP